MIKPFITLSNTLLWLSLILYGLDTGWYTIAYQSYIKPEVTWVGDIVIMILILSLLILAVALFKNSSYLLGSTKYNQTYGLSIIFMFVGPGILAFGPNFFGYYVLSVGLMIAMQLGLIILYPAEHKEEKTLRWGLVALTTMIMVTLIYIIQGTPHDPLLVRGWHVIICGGFTFALLRTNKALVAYHQNTIIVTDASSTEELLYTQP